MSVELPEEGLEVLDGRRDLAELLLQRAMGDIF
jgi:hypothetical protein